MSSPATDQPSARPSDPGIRVLRSSPGRLRVAVAGEADRAGLETAIRAAPGVKDVSYSDQTRNLLVTFDIERTRDEDVLAVIAGAVSGGRAASARPSSRRARPRQVVVRDLAPDDGWLAAEASCLIAAAPSACAAAILDFAAYPDWQQYVAGVEILERDSRGRGTIVRTVGRVGDQAVVHVMRYGYPAPSRIVWDQIEGELDAMRGEWRLRSVGGSATRATCRLEIRLGLRLRLLLRGDLYRQARDALFTHALTELRTRVEPAVD